MKNIMIKVSGPLTSCMQARAIIEGEKFSSFICGVDVYADCHMIIATGPRTWGYSLKDLADNMLRYATESNYDLKNKKLVAIEFCDDSYNVHSDHKKTQKMIQELKPHLEWILEGIDIIDDVATTVEIEEIHTVGILNWIDEHPNIKCKNTKFKSKHVFGFKTVSDINLKDISLYNCTRSDILSPWILYRKGEDRICTSNNGRCILIEDKLSKTIESLKSK